MRDMNDYPWWVARADKGTMMISGLVGVFTTEVQAQDARVHFQGTTHAGLSGDVFVVIDSLNLPLKQELGFVAIGVE